MEIGFKRSSKIEGKPNAQILLSVSVPITIANISLAKESQMAILVSVEQGWGNTQGHRKIGVVHGGPLM
jgi:hypothetical protein